MLMIMKWILKKCQAWRGRKRQARGHHLPSSIQDDWIAIDGQKYNILASLCLAGYLAGNWLQKLETNTQNFFLFLCVCVFVCVWYLSLIYL